MSEADRHYIIEIHIFESTPRHREHFTDRIIEEAFRYEDDAVFVQSGPCDGGDECHGDEDEDDY